MFKNLDRYEKLKLIDGLEPKKYNKGEYIVKEGDEGEYFYIIEEGEVECLKTPKDPKNDLIAVRSLGVGEHFGELSLLNDAKRSLSVRVKTNDCKVLCLNRDAFGRILGDINKYLKRDYNGEFDSKFNLSFR